MRDRANRPGFTQTRIKDLPEEKRLADLTEKLLAEQLAARLACKRAASQLPGSSSENH